MHAYYGLTIATARSIYQDIPVHSLEEFQQLAPEEARTEEVLADEHQLMLNRLSFELSERQRYSTPKACVTRQLNPRIGSIRKGGSSSRRRRRS